MRRYKRLQADVCAVQGASCKTLLHTACGSDTAWRRAHLWLCEGLISGLSLKIRRVIVLVSSNLGEQILRAVEESCFIAHDRDNS